MSQNSRESPVTSKDRHTDERKLLDYIGLFLSLCGLIGTAAVGHFGPLVSSVGMYVAFACLPGLLFSFLGMFRAPRTIAALGLGLGAFGTLYLPTFYLALSSTGGK